MTWYEDYYVGSSDYPRFHESVEFVLLSQDHEEPAEAESVSELHAALELLTEKQRFVVEISWGLRGGGPCSFYEIAELMGVQPQSVKETYGRAMGRLRGLLVSP